MWARRCGVPKLLPSQVKVIVSTVMITVFVFSSVLFFHEADARLLDLTSPASDQIRCFRPSDECSREADVTTCMLGSRTARGLRYEHLNSTCPVADAPRLNHSTCSNVSVAIKSLNGDLLLQTFNSFNSFGLWSLIFGVMGFAVLGVVLVHDMAMLSESARTRILDMAALDEGNACYWRVIRMCQFRDTLKSLKDKSTVLFACVLPFWILWQAAAFLLVMLPMTFIAFLCCCKCVALSRLMAFFVSLCVALWSVTGFLWWIFADTEYQVPWNESLQDGSVCVCMCAFYLDFTTRLHIWSLNIVFLWQATALLARTLKGLRRQQWASLLSVLYTVPINIYPVRWSQPNGERVKWRERFRSVQEEPAFDPFCLMDEQPESGRMKVLLRPTPMHAEERRRWANAGEDAVIGFCGFPKKALDSGAPKKGRETSEESYHIIDDEEAGSDPQDDELHDRGEDGLSTAFVSEMSLAEARAQLVEAHALINLLRQQLKSQHQEASEVSFGDDSLDARQYYGS